MRPTSCARATQMPYSPCYASSNSCFSFRHGSQNGWCRPQACAWASLFSPRAGTRFGCSRPRCSSFLTVLGTPPRCSARHVAGYFLSSFAPIAVWAAARYAVDGSVSFKTMVEYDLLARSGTTLEEHHGRTGSTTSRFCYSHPRPSPPPSFSSVVARAPSRTRERSPSAILFALRTPASCSPCLLGRSCLSCCSPS